MDSEHRHDLEENALATWLSDKIEEAKPHLPMVGIGIVAVIAGIIGLNGWKASTASAKADRWRDFSIALEGSRPNLDLLRQASSANPGTAVQEWADATWADARLFEAVGLYFRDREKAQAAIDEAVEVYERLTTASDVAVAERTAFQLARAYELQGKLDEAIEQYGRVTGAFVEVAKARAEELGTDQVRDAYAWITAIETDSATTTIDSLLGGGDLEPDDIAMPEEDAEATIAKLLDEVASEVNAAEQAESEEAPPATAEESTDAPPTEPPAEPAETASESEEQPDDSAVSDGEPAAPALDAPVLDSPTTPSDE